MTKIAPLPDISEVTPLSENDQPVINDVIEILRKHGALNRFGLTLLHQHFPIDEDEVMVESTDIQARTQTIKPVKKNELTDLNYTDTSWRLDTGKAVTACVCVNFGNEHQHLSRG